jgi:TatD DNase family protein
MNKTLFDTHAHISSQELYPEIDQIIDRAKKNHVDYILNVACDLESLENGLFIQNKYPFVYLASAIHPHDAEKNNTVFSQKIERALHDKKLIALGEIGLDYYYKYSSKEAQKKQFIHDLKISSDFDLPVIIHCREAYQDLFPLIDQYYSKTQVVLHCFTGNKEEAKEAIKRNWKISFSGIITFDKSLALQEIAKEIPLDNLLIETDAPYLAPTPYRGKRNEPSYLIETAKKLSEIKSESFEKICQITTDNALKFFRLSKKT